uniref:Uncharacterized protein n=1 Tax=Sphaerodactylus townsendi TaxID=933632 RepID=A0ACB8E837_9SAUR
MEASVGTEGRLSLLQKTFSNPPIHYRTDQHWNFYVKTDQEMVRSTTVSELLAQVQSLGCGFMNELGEHGFPVSLHAKIVRIVP